MITGGSPGNPPRHRLKLAENATKVAVHYDQEENQAKSTLEKIRASGSDGFAVQADICKPEEIRLMFARVKSEFGALDIFVNNARPEVPTSCEGPMATPLDMFDFAMDLQAKAFLVGVREAVRLGRDGGRIVALTYAPGGRFGGWQPWVAMAAAKAALEVLCRYFAVALAPRQRQRAQHAPAGGARLDPELAAGGMDPQSPSWHACGHWKRRPAALLGGSEIGSPGRHWMWIAAPRSWTRSKSSRCRPRRPTPPSSRALPVFLPGEE